MSFEQLRNLLAEARDNWDDAYWRADHPEVVYTVVAIATGIIGLLFAVLQALTLRRLQTDA